ncbi:cysteine synthase family protein [Sedimentisphaerales bacterium M17dextr]|uniref:cysteine synthase n=2 Tax=Anaerobaca lacustris TaxID=3044600 RepID=A0AAW6TVB2_9BACT|nr:cysteine synthase family protein [Sedimentisphaerales bacterium M17dextr]
MRSLPASPAGGAATTDRWAPAREMDLQTLRPDRGRVLPVGAGITSAIGNTPVIELTRLNHTASDVRIFGKLEGANPGGSIKDRPAHYMIASAERSGALTAAKTILEATSGNTGIALAMIGAAKGYRVKLCMPNCVSLERQRILQALGAEVVLTSACEHTDGAIRTAHRLLASAPGTYYMPNQYENQGNLLAHYETTGPEIFAQTAGRVDVVVAGMGTTGTLMGLHRFFAERKPSVRIVGVEPAEGHAIQGLKNMTESMIPAIYDPNALDEKITIDDEEAFETTRLLAVREGVFVGMSSGAAVAAARRLAIDMRTGVIVAILPDRGDRYLSTTLFRSVCAKCPP